jgi:hypothetical protein
VVDTVPLIIFPSTSEIAGNDPDAAVIVVVTGTFPDSVVLPGVERQTVAVYAPEAGPLVVQAGPAAATGTGDARLRGPTIARSRTARTKTRRRAGHTLWLGLLLL